MATVSIFMPEMSLTTGNVLWLRKSSDYSVVNTGGDALTESGTSGWFTATVTETWTEQLSVTVVDTNSLIPRTGWLPVGGTTVVEGTAVLDPATQTQVNNIENASGYLLAVLAGECADPQTASETYAITVFGSTFTVDMAGQTSTGTRTAPTLTKT